MGTKRSDIPQKPFPHHSNAVSVILSVVLDTAKAPAHGQSLSKRGADRPRGSADLTGHQAEVMQLPKT